MTGSNEDHTGRKLKILALHSMHTSAAFLRVQIARAGLAEALADLVDLEYVDAPFSVPKEEVEVEITSHYGGPYLRWFNVTGWPQAKPDKAADAKGMEICVSALRETMGKRSYNGILGFSLGSVAANTVLSLQHRGKHLQDVPKLRFAIFIAGVRDPEDSKRYPALYDDAFRQRKILPSLHIYGKKDPYRKYSECLANDYADPVVIQHPKGHVVPKLDKGDIEKLRKFLSQQPQTCASRL